MPASVEKMLLMQEKDKHLLKLEEQMKEEPARVNSLKEDCDAKKNILEETKQKQKQMLVNRNSLETEVGSLSEKINKCQGQLYQLKSNEDYRAMEKEIDGMIAKKSDLEDQIIQSMEDYDEAAKEVKLKEDILKESEAVLAKEQEKLKQDLLVIEGDKKKLEEEVEGLAKGIDTAVLNLYKRISLNKPGAALAPIEDGICGGCNMLLRPNALNEVMKSSDKNIVTCENCARILYYIEQQ